MVESTAPEKRSKKKKNQIEEMNLTIEDFENEMPEIKSRIEADSLIYKNGMNVFEKNTGDVMLIAAMYGLVNVIKFYECP
jgi:CRISPR/Cas system CSM-associated protein Csm4 (group 5 of RAMP superfamily)